jgi:hypothetical protein
LSASSELKFFEVIKPINELTFSESTESTKTSKSFGEISLQLKFLEQHLKYVVEGKKEKIEPDQSNLKPKKLFDLHQQILLIKNKKLNKQSEEQKSYLIFFLKLKQIEPDFN